jgi:hypothetical protein
MHEYVRIATEHDARQPFIKDELIEAINQYSCVTFRQLSGHINHWCQYSCISAWLHTIGANTAKFEKKGWKGIFSNLLKVIF